MFSKGTVYTAGYFRMVVRIFKSIIRKWNYSTIIFNVTIRAVRKLNGRFVRKFAPMKITRYNYGIRSSWRGVFNSQAHSILHLGLNTCTTTSLQNSCHTQSSSKGVVTLECVVVLWSVHPRSYLLTIHDSNFKKSILLWTACLSYNYILPLN